MFGIYDSFIYYFKKLVVFGSFINAVYQCSLPMVQSRVFKQFRCIAEKFKKYVGGRLFLLRLEIQKMFLQLFLI